MNGSGRVFNFLSNITPDPRIQAHHFIAGCGHSGTTLIANILSTHDQLYVPLRETRLLRTQTYKRRLRYKRLAAEVVRSGKPYMVEKTPSHIRNLDEIRQIFPGARMIVPVRDGRDVAASYFKRHNDKKRGIRAWINLNEFAAQNMDAQDVFIYRHEDLVDNLEEKLRQICEFLNVNYDPELLNYHQKQQKWHGHRKIRYTEKRSGRHHDVRRNWQVNQPVYKSSGLWKEHMTEDDFPELLNGRGAELMQMFGYA